MNSKVASLLARLSFAAAASVTVSAPALIAGEARAAVISAADRCHADLATSTRRYIERVLRARVRCLDGKIDGLYPPTTNCLTDDEEPKLNKRLRKAQDKLSNMGSECGGVNLTLLGYPGVCADPTPMTAFDTQDLKTCVVIKADDIVENLLDYYFPPINDFFRGSDARCMKGTGTDGSTSFRRMLRARERCLLGQDVGLVDDEVNCRGEILPYGPGTGSDTVDLEISRAYIRLLGAIPASCVDVQIDDLNYQSSCPDPTGGIFTIFDLKDCLFNVNRAAALQTLAINFATEAICGDGTVQAGEECDDGVGTNGNSNTRPNACRTDCKRPKCGDSVTDTAAPNNETCDDGNTDETDCCPSTCVLSGCGDGVLNAACGEECDTGSARSNTLPDRCRLDCQDFGCGDNVQDTGEECDDPAPAENGDGCSALCLDEFCGDDIIQTGLGEQCDNGIDNANAPDKCRATGDFKCKNPQCGDSIIDVVRGETCDDGNTSNTDACSFPGCTIIVEPECGNGTVEAPEECDGDNNDCPAGEGCIAVGQPNDCNCEPACPGVGELILHSGIGEECAVDADCPVGTCDISKGKCVTVTRLDSGWNGAAHNADINNFVRTRGFLDCPGHGPTCGQCNVDGLDPSTRTCRCEKDIRQLCDDKFEVTSQCLTCDGGGVLNNTACDANSDCLSAGTCTRNVRVCANDMNKVCTANSQCPGSTCNAAATRTTCTNATTTFCTSAAQCSFQGTCNKPSTCNCYLGAPFPLSSQGTPACVLNRFSQDVFGTANVDLGAGSITAKLRTVVYLGPGTTKPCATCGGKCSNNPSLLCDRDLDCEGGTCDLDDFMDDGDRGGFCVGGAHEGLACDVQSLNTSFPAFPEGPNGGGYSLDCLPIPDSNISGTGLIINLTQTTGTSQLVAQQSCLGQRPDQLCPCLMCTGTPSEVPCNTNLDCLEASGTCSGSSAIQCTFNADCATANGGNCTANGNTRCSLAIGVMCANNSECASVNVGNCVAATCTSAGGFGFPEPNACDNGLCTTLSDETGECTQGPDNSYCSGVLRANGEGILGCSLDEDCHPDAVGIDARPCSTVIRRKCFPDPIVATGDPDPGKPIGAATFCIPPTVNPGVNAAAGLPGPGRVINQATSKTFCGTSTQQYIPGVGGCVDGQVP